MPSSVVASIQYNASSSTLRVTYVSGIVYDYKNVPEEVYAAMKIAFSKRYIISLPGGSTGEINHCAN